MSLEHQIIVFELFLKDHLMLKTGVKADEIQHCITKLHFEMY